MNVSELFKEARWLNKINKRDKEAFSRCYDFYAPRIYRHAFYRLGSQELAEDVVSDVFIKTWEFLTDPNNKILNLKAFLYRIANNLIIDRYRAGGRELILTDEASETQFTDEGRSVEKLDANLEFEAVFKSLEKLNPEAREILIWRYVDQLNIGEIAELSGKTKNAVYVAIHRALKEMQKLLKNDYENL